MKHKDEWDDFILAVQTSYGFNKLCCPMIFTVEGQLIGDTKDFTNYAKDHFGKEYTEAKEILIKRAKEN